MEKMMGLINLEYESQLFNELTNYRTSASLPFAGRYRLIDFTLSNMVNSNIDEIGLFVSNKYRSLLDHLGTGAHWDLDRSHGGLFILPPDWNDPYDLSRGDLRYFHNNRDYFNRSKATHVLISGSQFVANTDYNEAFKLHIDRDADITLIAVKTDKFQSEHDSVFRIESDDLGWVGNITNDLKNPLLFSGVYIIKKDVLMDLVNDCIAYHHDHFFVHGVIGQLPRLKVQMYLYEGYHLFVNSVESFYRHNMHLLDEANYRELFFKKNFIRTKISNNMPIKYRDNAKVTKSILSNGCIIDGKVEKSILFRGVEIKQGAVVKNSIIMQRCRIDEDVYLENVILDKDVHVTKGQRLIGSKEKPFIVAKREIV